MCSVQHTHTQCIYIRRTNTRTLTWLLHLLERAAGFPSTTQYTKCSKLEGHISKWPSRMHHRWHVQWDGHNWNVSEYTNSRLTGVWTTLTVTRFLNDSSSLKRKRNLTLYTDIKSHLITRWLLHVLEMTAKFPTNRANVLKWKRKKTK